MTLHDQAQLQIQTKMQNMHDEMMLVRESIQEIAKAVTRLAVLEEKHNITSDKCDKLGEKIDDLAKVVQINETNQAIQLAKIDGAKSAMKLLWAVFGGAVVYGGGQLLMLIMHLKDPIP